MAGTATARKLPRSASATTRKSARPASAQRPRRSHLTPIPGRLVPIAVSRTAGAVGGLADSGVVVRLTRGRLWIGALAVLLVGIVALNVMALSLNAASSKTGSQADELKQQNSALRAQLAGEISRERVQRLASALGLVFPEPDAIRYPNPEHGDAAEAARRLRSGELALSDYVPAAPVAETPVGATPVEPTAPPVTEEAPVEAPTTTPGTTETAPTQPPPAAAGGGAGGGGVASP